MSTTQPHARKLNAATRRAPWILLAPFLVLFALTGAAWLDPVAGFVIAAFAIHEGREAWEGELVEDDDDDD